MFVIRLRVCRLSSAEPDFLARLDLDTRHRGQRDDAT